MTHQAMAAVQTIWQLARVQLRFFLVAVDMQGRTLAWLHWHDHIHLMKEPSTPGGAHIIKLHIGKSGKAGAACTQLHAHCCCSTACACPIALLLLLLLSP
jgi:hypothetical protein